MDWSAPFVFTKLKKWVPLINLCPFKHGLIHCTFNVILSCFQNLHIAVPLSSENLFEEKLSPGKPSPDSLSLDIREKGCNPQTWLSFGQYVFQKDEVTFEPESESIAARIGRSQTTQQLRTGGLSSFLDAFLSHREDGQTCTIKIKSGLSNLTGVWWLNSRKLPATDLLYLLRGF